MRTASPDARASDAEHDAGDDAGADEDAQDASVDQPDIGHEDDDDEGISCVACGALVDFSACCTRPNRSSNATAAAGARCRQARRASCAPRAATLMYACRARAWGGKQSWLALWHLLWRMGLSHQPRHGKQSGWSEQARQAWRARRRTPPLADGRRQICGIWPRREGRRWRRRVWMTHAHDWPRNGRSSTACLGVVILG